MATTTPPNKKIVILGGSYAGMSSAHYILKHVIPKLPSNESYQVILASASSQALCRPACPRSLISNDMFAQEKLFVDIKQQFVRYSPESFSFITGTAMELDHTNRTVSVTSRIGEVEKIEFYALVIATGLFDLG
ncbi:hypothetical protein K504DRAFT_460806 [Pleomassaria siparia CBS 279.74]|uniref:FAD/NAD(P)-binding domain-containing protein n=1 Tax=Pleomassaria siparia CBS 279.74 TaxID=1314801 RepID=A0A6G1JXT1_9PLEO|nr:hypothetical protein K504DRAFT_460806 [Pleomassaria siparia CBS 279.74]